MGIPSVATFREKPQSVATCSHAPFPHNHTQNAEYSLFVKMGHMSFCKGQEACRSFLRSRARPG